MKPFVPTQGQIMALQGRLPRKEFDSQCMTMWELGIVRMNPLSPDACMSLTEEGKVFARSVRNEMPQ